MKTYYCFDIKRIQQIMKQRGITEQQLAEQTNISPKRLHRYLHTEWLIRVPFSVYYPIFNALDVPIKTIIMPVPPEKIK